jgi:hypothetical protein
MNAFPEVGAIVRLDARPEWGVGQIQSVVGARVTVNFEHAGKVVIDTAEAALTLVDDDWL